jgi:hypothetical protein
MNFITRIPIICAIKNNIAAAIDNVHYEINTKNTLTIHNMLLSKLSDGNKFPALIFENDIYMTQIITDSIRTEIFGFITTNPTWDIIILSPIFLNLSLTHVSGNISKLNDNKIFYYSSVYFASSRFMYKNKTNNVTDIQTYVYTNPFLENMDNYINNSGKNNGYTVGIVSDIKVFSLDNIKYNFDPILLS